MHGNCCGYCQRLLGKSVQVSHSQKDPSPLRYHLPNGSAGHPAYYYGQHPVYSLHLSLQKPLRYWDIYVDDFCRLFQGNIWTRRWVKRILLRSLDRVFRPLDDHDTAFHQEPASLKKMKQGDATWTTSKVILGWLIDTKAKTITLPLHRFDRLCEILDSIAPDQRTIATKDWHKVLGELCSMSIALPGLVDLFS